MRKKKRKTIKHLVQIASWITTDICPWYSYIAWHISWFQLCKFSGNPSCYILTELIIQNVLFYFVDCAKPTGNQFHYSHIAHFETLKTPSCFFNCGHGLDKKILGKSSYKIKVLHTPLFLKKTLLWVLNCAKALENQ